MGALSLTTRPDGVAVITFDTPDSPVNTLSRSFFDEFEQILNTVESNGDIKAVVLASAKPDNFIAGANLKEILAMKDAAEGAALSSGGRCSAQSPIANRHRVRNVQPDGGLIGDGISPVSASILRSLARFGSAIGTAVSSAFV